MKEAIVKRIAEIEKETEAIKAAIMRAEVKLIMLNGGKEELAKLLNSKLDA